MIVGEKAVASVYDGACDMEGIGNPQAVSSAELCRPLPHEGIGADQFHAFRFEEPIVSLQHRPIILPQRLHAAFQSAEVGDDDQIRSGARSCKPGDHRLSKGWGAFDEVDDRGRVEVETHVLFGPLVSEGDHLGVNILSAAARPVRGGDDLQDVRTHHRGSGEWLDTNTDASGGKVELLVEAKLAVRRYGSGNDMCGTHGDTSRG
jgi:hypothetical protein